MTAPVDVLAVLDEFVVLIGDEFGNETALRLREARAAVAELMDALRNERSVRSSYASQNDGDEPFPWSDEPFPWSDEPFPWSTVAAAIKRTDAALARRKGEKV